MLVHLYEFVLLKMKLSKNNLAVKMYDLLPSGSEQNQVLRGSSIPKEYFVIGELGVKVGLKVVRVVGNGAIETSPKPWNAPRIR